MMPWSGKYLVLSRGCAANNSDSLLLVLLPCCENCFFVTFALFLRHGRCAAILLDGGAFEVSRANRLNNI